MTDPTTHEAPTAVTVNGEATLLRSTAIRDLLCELNYDPDQGGVAVAVNAEVVPRSEWETLTIRAGDAIEIVGARQGG